MPKFEVMKKTLSFAVAKISLFLLMGLMLNACFEREKYSETPKITFKDIKFIDTKTIDSLILTFDFEDESGDIGLGSNDNRKPFHVFDIVIDSKDSIVRIGDKNLSLPLYLAPVIPNKKDGSGGYTYFPSQKVLFSEKDNRPAYNCESYKVDETDTVYIKKNPFYKNIYISFEEKKSGEYKPIDFNKIFNKSECDLGDFNARIPVFTKKSRKGIISYAMVSQALRVGLFDKTIRIKFYIYDRAQHKSNDEYTKDFVLKDITIKR